VVRKAHREGLIKGPLSFHGGVHQDPPPPEVSGKHVLLVDFSYKGEDLEWVLSEAASVTIIDHHKTAQKEIQPLLDEGAVDGVFDMDRSGAKLAWDWFFLGREAPFPLMVVQDRDLWTWQLEATRPMMAAIFSFEYDFKTLDWLMECASPLELLDMGHAINRKHDKDVAELVASGQQEMEIGGYLVPGLNAPYFFSSDAGHIMVEQEQAPFAACYWDTPEGRTFSLRSRAGGVDVSEIAKQYGGGGHASAAGFRVPHWHDLAHGL